MHFLIQHAELIQFAGSLKQVIKGAEGNSGER